MRAIRLGLCSTFILAAAIAGSPAGAQQSAPAAPAAQPAAPAEPRGPAIEEIIVTSQHRSESIQEVPIAMTAFTEELDQATIRDIRDLNGLSANVRIDGNPERAGGSSITIRGVSPTRVDDNSLDSPIGVMIDGIYLGSLSGQVLENFDLERVEILRGPQGTLYGRNTIGGVLHVIRSEPTGEWGGKFQYTTGSYDQQEFRAVLNAPIIEEKLAAKLFYTNISRDGYFKNEFLRVNQPQRDYQNFGLTLKATPTDWFEAVLTIEKFNDDSQVGSSLFNWNFAPGLQPAPPPGSPEPNYSGGFFACTGLVIPGPPPTNFVINLPQQVPCRTSLKTPKRISTDIANPASAETGAYTLNMTAQLGENLELVSVTGYRDLVEDRKLDFDGTSVNHITLERLNDFQQFSQEFRLEGNWESGLGNIDYVFGAYYWRSEFEQDWVTGGNFWTFIGGLSGYSFADNTWSPTLLGTIGAASNPGLLPLQACIANPGGAPFGNVRCDSGANNLAGLGENFVQRLFEHQVTKSGAVFAHVDWEIIEDVTLTGGIRYTTEKKDFTGAQAYLAPLARQRVKNFPAFARLDNKWNDISPKAGVAWAVTEDVNVYATYSEGWHSGGFFGVNQNVADFNRDQYDPEFSQSGEGGLKTRLFDGRVQANFAYFWNKFRNKQEQAVQFDASTQTVATVFSNVATAIYQGFEGEVQVAVTDGLNLFGTFGWLDARYTQFETDINPNDSCTGLPICVVDASYLKPRNAPKYSAGVGGSFTFGVGPGDITLATKYAYTSEIEGALLNLTANRVSPRSDVQASIAYGMEFDGGYKAEIALFGRNLTDQTFEFPAIIAPVFASSTVGLGRTWGLQLTGEF